MPGWHNAQCGSIPRPRPSAAASARPGTGRVGGTPAGARGSCSGVWPTYRSYTAAYFPVPRRVCAASRLADINGSLPDVPRTLTRAFPGHTGDFPSLTGAFPSLTGAFPSLTGAFPSLTGAFPSLTGAFPSLTGAFPSLKRAFPRLEGVNAGRTGVNTSLAGVRYRFLFRSSIESALLASSSLHGPGMPLVRPR